MQHNEILDDICKASMIKAVTALSKLLKTPLKIDIKPIEINTIQKINLPNYDDNMMVCVFVPIKDNVVKGGSSLIFTQQSAFSICDSLLNRTEGSTNKITEIEESALKELANIILGNFLAPFANSLLIGTLIHSPAVFENDSSPEVIKHTRLLLRKYVDQETVVNIAFGYEHDNKTGDINIVFNSKEINHLLKTLMVISND